MYSCHIIQQAILVVSIANKWETINWLFRIGSHELLEPSATQCKVCFHMLFYLRVMKAFASLK